MIASLHAWLRTWHELGAFAADEVLHRRLLACWAEPHRRYHTPQHLRECLLQLEGARGDAQRPAEVELALWFHDAFYDPQRSDNERRSAQWARSSVLQAGLPIEVAARVEQLVLATQHGTPPDAADSDLQLLLDIDLSVLGAAPEPFDAYEQQVRAEYGHLDDAAWRSGRARLLRSFLDRPRIFATPRFRASHEARARENLARALSRL